ncbi:Na/Pi cotransporter family protein [Prolixibacteraceae bacterium Z1-6]|uniref:Na/Pi cotransporter family protein n=1 Tax=Draconibacterium aestuarii TaxID=2998507 RepID=A0A9X3F875_9BACT|nr:Na/Pi cotransporter family protein [Prolixibacteraceae bacterium Z1-6]
MNWWTFTILLLGGLAIFLHGMNVMTDGLKAAAGSRMKLFLKSMTRNRWTSLLAGTCVTAVIQSSSVTTVLAVGFVSAGLLSFQSTLGLILGANIGTTITAQIIAFKITKASWLMVAFGYLFSVVFAKKSYKDFGTIILGLGLVFLGMNVMSEATTPLKTYLPFIELMEGLDNYLWGILIGTVFTAAVQSSSATTGVVIVLASQGLISVEAGIAIILGANVGTCITAVLSAIGKPRAAMRVAISHVFFKVAGVLLWYAFIDQLATLVGLISEGNNARQIANAHTIFNVGNTLLFIWLVNPVSKLILWILPVRKDTKKLFPELHSYYLEDTSMAIDLANSSISKLGKMLLKLIENGLNVALTGNASQLLELRKNDAVIDRGQKEILAFLQQIQSQSILKKETKRLEQDIEAVNVLETAADLITTNLVEAAEHRIKNGFEVSAETIEKLSALYAVAFDALSTGLKEFSGQSLEKGEKLSKMEFKEQLQDVRSYLIRRLSEPDEMRISIYRFESEVLEVIRRLHSLARRLERKAG